MKGKIIIINTLYYFFNNNINCGCFCKKLSCKNDTRQINDEVRKENDNQKKEDDEEKKRKDDILKKKREELLEKYKNLKSKNDELPENERIDIGYNEEFIKVITVEESLKTISDTFDKKEKDILAIWKRINKKKYEEELKKTFEDRKKECNNLLEEVNNLIKDNFTKYFKKDVKINDDTCSKINKINKKVDIDDLDEIKKAIDDLDEIKDELNNKKNEVDKLIKEDEEKDKYFCKTKEDFIQKFNERKNILADSFFIDSELKNELKTNNLEEKDISDYYIMYQQMTADVFNHEISLDLQIYRYILKLEGFTIALDNIFKSDVKLHIPTIAYDSGDTINNIEGVKCGDKYYFSKNILRDLKVIFDKEKITYEDSDVVYDILYKDIEFKYLKENTRNFINSVNVKTGFFGVKINDKTKVREIEEKIKYINNKLGEITVENEKFKYLRCNDKCTNGDNCVSCKLRKLLEKENCLDLFLNIYKQQGEDSNKPEAMLMKRIIYDGLKKDKKYDFYSLNFESRKKNFCKEITNEFRKSVMIEWALTIEFMKKFIPKYYGSDNFNLYRTFNRIDSVDKIKSDIYESTSLIGNFFIGINEYNINRIDYAGSFFTKIENIKYYKCLFNYIVSPNDKKILKDDSEVEIGFICIDEKYVENKIVNYENDEDVIAKQYMKYLEDTRHENFDKNFGEGKWEEIDVSI